MNFVQVKTLNTEEAFEGMMAQLNKEAGRNGISSEARATAKDVFTKTCDFLSKHHLFNSHIAESKLGDLDTSFGMESFNTDANLLAIGSNAILALVDECGVPRENRNEAAKSVCTLLSRFKAAKGNDQLYRNNHFVPTRKPENQALIDKSFSSVFPQSLNFLRTSPVFSNEAFGANIDTVHADIRSSLAIDLLRYHRGILDRIIYRRSSPSPYVTYKVPYAEVYDMLLSNDPDASIRNEGDHIKPFIDLYTDPRAVSNTLQPVVPLVSNDKDNCLVSDGVIKFDKAVNLFDLSMRANQIGYDHVNYTDLLSENVVFKSVILRISDGSTDELVRVSTENLTGSRFLMPPNVNDSGLRSCMLRHILKLDQHTTTVTGAKSSILSVCTDTDFVRAEFFISSYINLKYADTRAVGTVEINGYNSNKAQLSEALKTLMGKLTVSLEGYELDACYSEENLRKSNLAIRYNVRTFVFEISNGRNIFVDYSLEEVLPEFLMSLITEATSLGQDHRGVDIIIKTLLHVYDTTMVENQNPEFRDRLEKIGFQYISGQQVRPVVKLATIDMSDVQSIRDGDYLGDVRARFETNLLNLISLVHQNSLYRQQLNPGETPKFKVLTSSVILENLLSIPHYHNHLDKSTPSDGSTVEYRRVLPNGTVLDCVTTAYDYLRDKLILIPYRDNSPEDTLNFGHNWDCGTFVAHYNPQFQNSVNKRVFSNSRTMVIPTCPIGLYINVENLSKIENMFELTNPHPNGSTVISPADILARTMDEVRH